MTGGALMLSFLKDAKKENIYKTDGFVPLRNAVPLGIQHVFAMFVANITPIIVIAAAATYNGEPLTAAEKALLIQNCMLIAGIGTLIQLFPVWRIGSGLPLVMGISFTFLPACFAAALDGYGVMIGSVIFGGIFEGLLGLTAKYWKKIITPVTSACVVISIGLSILYVGASSFASSYAYPTGAPENLAVGLVTLTAALVFHSCLKGTAKQMYVLFAMAVGYVVSLFFGMVDFDSMFATIGDIGIVAVPRVFAYVPEFRIGSIIPFVLIFMVSAVETMGDTTAVCNEGLGRDPTDREISGSLCVDGFISAISSGVFGCPPITSFSQNVGLIAMTGVVNRFCIMFSAIALILGGLFPPIGAFFSMLPDCVLGGCTVIMFGSIVVAGMKMLAKAGFGSRNTIITAASLCIGIGATQAEGFFDCLPEIVGDIYSKNIVAGVFTVGLILEIAIPKEKEKKETAEQ